MDSTAQIERLTSLLAPEVQPHAQAILKVVRDFCEEHAFSAEQVEVALALLAEVMEKDMEGGTAAPRPISASIAHYQYILTKHAVERPPRSRGTFLPSEAVALYDLVVKVYFRKFGLFQYLAAGGSGLLSAANETYSAPPLAIPAPTDDAPTEQPPVAVEAAASQIAPQASISEKASISSVSKGKK